MMINSNFLFYQLILFIICSLQLLLIPTSIAAVSAPLTLKSAIDKTLAHNPALHQFTLYNEQLRAEHATQALSPGYQLGVELENIAGTGEHAGIKGAELTVALSSVIELGHQRVARIERSNAEYDQFQITRQINTLDLLGQLTQDFILTLTTQEEQKLAFETTQLAEALLIMVKQNVQQGALSDIETLRAEARLAQAQIDYKNSQKQLERQYSALEKFWGSTQITFSELQGDLFSFTPITRFKALYQRVQQSPHIAHFASAMRLKEAAVRLAETQSTADLSWQLGVRHLRGTNDTALVAGFSIPLSTKKRTQGQINAALADRNALAYEQAQRQLVLHQQLFTAYSQREQHVEAYYQLNTQVIPTLIKALALTRNAYDYGRLQYQDWVIAQQELLHAKQQSITQASAALLNQAIIEQLIAAPL